MLTTRNWLIKMELLKRIKRSTSRNAKAKRRGSKMTYQEYVESRTDLAERISALYYCGPVRRIDGELVYDTGDEEILVSEINFAVSNFVETEDEINRREQERQALITERKKLEDSFDANFLGPKNKGKLNGS